MYTRRGIPGREIVSSTPWKRTTLGRLLVLLAVATIIILIIIVPSLDMGISSLDMMISFVLSLVWMLAFVLVLNPPSFPRIDDMRFRRWAHFFFSSTLRSFITCETIGLLSSIAAFVLYPSKWVLIGDHTLFFTFNLAALAYLPKNLETEDVEDAVYKELE